MNYEKMTKAELISKIKSLESGIENSRCRSLFENMLNGYAYCKILVDENNKPIDFVYLEVNDAFETLTGLKKDLVIGRKVTEVIPGISSSEPDLFEIYGKVAFTGVGTRFDIYFEPLNKWFSISVYCPEKGYFVAVFDNITERKKTEELLKSSGDYLQKLNDSLGAAIFTVKIPERVIEYVNCAVENIFGYKPDECIGKKTEIFYPTVEKYHDFGRSLKSAIKEGKNELKEERLYKRKNGEIFPCEVTITFLKRNEKIVRVITILQDITERKQAEEDIMTLNKTLEQRVLERTEELRTSEERFRELAETIPEVFWLVSPDFNRVLYVSPAYEIIWGRTCKSRYERPKSWMDSIHPDDRDGVTSAIEDYIHGKGDFVEEYRIVRPDGSERWIQDRGFSIMKPPGVINYIIGIAQDITSRKQSEDKFRIQNSYLNLLKVAAVAANKAEDIKDAFQPILKEICRYTGWEIGHAYTISKDDPDLLEPTKVWWLEDSKHFEKFCSVSKKIKFAKGIGLPGRVLANSKPHWIVDVTKDKNFLRKKIASDMNIKSGIAFPVMVGTKVAAVLSFFTTKASEPDKQLMDIMAEVGTQLGRTVERKQAKHVLEKNYLAQKILNDLLKISHKENTLMELLEHAIDIILGMPWLTSKMGGIFMVESDPEVLILKVQRNLPKRLLEVCNRVPFGMCLCGETALSGKIIHSETIDEDHVTRYKGIKSHGHYNVPILLNGKTIGVILLYLKARHSRDENEVIFLETLANTLSGIIKRKKMEEALVQSEKMKAMGIITAGVAHEFNNILAVISSNAQFLEETNRSDKELSKSLRTICRMSDDGAEIVDRMYDFTNVNKDVSRYINVDLNDLIKQVIGFTMPRWKEMAQADGKKYQIVRKGVKALPSVLGNPSELREVILNIINNALDAMPGGGTITVETRCVRSDEFGVESKKEKVSKLGTLNSELKSDFVKVTFTDTGNGMPEEVKKKLFDPFFTTRSPQGTGLGMSVSYGIVARHGGEINVESELGKGCIINLSLPITNKSIPHVVTSGQDSKSNVDGLNILVVDDNKEICESLGKIFTDDGHKVCSINNGTDAIKLLKKNSYDLLICDLVMPDVNGRDILNAIKTMNKRPKVGLITGWRYKLEDAEKDGLEVDFIVKKPFNLSKLRKRINDLWR